LGGGPLEQAGGANGPLVLCQGTHEREHGGAEAAARLDLRTDLSYSQRVKGRQLIRKLRRAGVDIEPRRGKGAHLRLRYRGRTSVMPMHGDKDIGPNLVHTICKQLGLDPKSVL